MDFANLTFTGLITIGVVNVITFYKPYLDSKIKFAISLVVAFGLTFVPPSVGNVIFDHLKQAVEVAFMSSGTYKVAQKLGGK